GGGRGAAAAARPAPVDFAALPNQVRRQPALAVVSGVEFLRPVPVMGLIGGEVEGAMGDEPDVQRRGSEDQNRGDGAPAPWRRFHLPSLAWSVVGWASLGTLAPPTLRNHTGAVRSSTSFAMTS